MSKKHPRRYTVPPEQRSADDTYFTPHWLIQMWVDHHTPALPRRVIDPCAGDGRIGAAFAAMEMFDLTPRDARVRKQNFLELERENFGGIDVSVVMNPPFLLARAFLEKSLDLAGDTGDVAMVLRAGCPQQVSWHFNPPKSLLPKHRVSFEITAEYAEELRIEAERKGKKPTHRRADCPSGWVLGSPGDDHGIFIFRQGWTGPTETYYIPVDGYLRGR